MSPETVIKWKETMSQIGPDGLTGFQRRAIKIKEARLAKNPNSYKDMAKKTHEKLSKIDQDGLSGFQKRREAIGKSMIANESNAARCEKIRATKLAKLSVEYRESIKRYRNVVMGLSRKHDLSDLEGFELWGAGGYELDHKFSIAEGFALKLPPELLSVKGNLQFILKRDNIVKGRKCSITIEELKALSC